MFHVKHFDFAGHNRKIEDENMGKIIAVVNQKGGVGKRPLP